MYQFHFPEKDFCSGEHYHRYGEDFQIWIDAVRKKLDSLTPRLRTITLRRILCLLLYHAFIIPDHWIEPLAPLTGVPAEYFAKLVEEIRAHSSHKLDKWKDTDQSLSRMFSNLKTHEIYLRSLENPRLYDEAQRKVEFYRSRVEGSRKKLMQLTLTTSQRKISQMLQMPSGTVNSAVHYAKKFLSDISGVSWGFCLQS